MIEQIKNLPTPDRELLEAAQVLIDKTITPLAPQWEREHRHCLDGLQAGAAIGLTGLQVPESMGGRGRSFRCKALLADLLAQADFGYSMALINTQNVAAKLASDAPTELAKRYIPDLLAARRIGCTALTEPHAGSDFAAITTLATPENDGWRITGRKAWITNAAAADVIVLYAQTEAGSGARGIAGFVIDGQREGFEREPVHPVTGQHSIGAGGFALNNYRATGPEMILAPGTAFKSALHSINGARIYVAAMCCGMLDSALSAAAQWGRERTSFGGPLNQHQGWRWILAEAAAELAAARALVNSAAQLIDNGQDAQFPAAKVKVFATRMAERHIGALMQAMGAQGLLQTHPFGRHLTGLQMASLVDGSTQMLLERIAAQFERA